MYPALLVVILVADLAINAMTRDSIALDIPNETMSITLRAVLRSGGRMFTDRRKLAVPQPTTEVERAASLPASCIRIIRIRSVP